MARHSGRFQAQGHDIRTNGNTRSKNWQHPAPYPAADGRVLLGSLNSDLEPAQQRIRVVAFQLARVFVDKCNRAGGVGPISKSYPCGKPGDQTDIRVDVVVDSGRAFV